MEHHPSSEKRRPGHHWGVIGSVSIRSSVRRVAKTALRRPLQPARRADADQLPHQQSEIEAADVDQSALQNVRVAAEVHAAHPNGLVEMQHPTFTTGC